MKIIKLDRVRGTLIGQFVGDALGTTLEFKAAAACKATYPAGLRDVVGGGPFSMKAGQVTDDGELAVTLARTLLAHGLDADARARAYAGWMRSNPPDKGNATVAAFGGWPEGVTAQEMLTRTAKVNGDAGKQANGALMRVSPLALYTATMEPDRVVELAMAEARFSHPSVVCSVANAAFVRAIQVGVQGGTPQDGLEAAQAAAKAGPVMDALEDIEAAPACDGAGQGWVLVALRMAFHQLLSARSFEDALVSTVMAGGDTDTNGAITGALLGAFHGAEAVPARWWTKVQGCRPASRPSAYHVHDALQLAELLVERGRLDSGPVASDAAVDVPAVAAPSPPEGKTLRRFVTEAGGKVVPHESDPSLLAIKIPLSNADAATKLGQLIGKTPIRGGKYFIFALPKAAVEDHAAQPPAATYKVPRPGVRTSETDPINVNWLPNQGTKGEVGLTFAPGKHTQSKSGSPWERNLAQDLDRLRDQHGIDVLVCLIEDRELQRLKIPNLVKEAEARGIAVHRLPIPDGGAPPTDSGVEEIVAVIRNAAQAGKKVLIHCQGGLGRAGTIGGSFLRACGVRAEEALRILVETRGPNCPENEEQREFVRKFR